jgi:hypothetical protein
MRILTGAFILFLVFYYGIGYLGDNPGVLGRKEGWLAVLIVLAALFYGIPRINDSLYGRRRGWGDGKCKNCSGAGRAKYDLGKYGIYEDCRACKGSGSGPGGPGNPKKS